MIVKATVMNILDTQTSFARMPDGEEVFIPALIAKNAGLSIGDEFSFRVKRQFNKPAEYIALEAIPDPALPSAVKAETQPLDRIVLQHVAARGIVTADAVLSALKDHGINVVADMLDDLHSRGELALAFAYQDEKGDEGLALYALDLKTFKTLGE